LHDLAMRDLADKIIERLLIFPDGKRPEFSSEWFCVEGIADHSRSGFELAARLHAVANEGRDDAEMFERKKGDQGEVRFAGDGSGYSSPGRAWHGQIVARTILDFWGGGGETFGAGANGAEMIVGVDASGVSVGERDLDGIVPYLGGGGGLGLWFEHGKDGRRSEGR